ncbi:fasciclin domain-containing protein [Flavisericum labens]|uniref:fasciclin domain-containing protein n=1 Tax=Flavisericum labens TaxID=3377112 RepID=UPI00387AB4FD
MISSKLYIRSFLGIIALVGVVACSDPWDDHTNKVDQNLTQNLTERIENTSQTSEFGKLLTETGLDGVLAGSKTHTVWAPNNDAMAQVNPELLSDLAKKRLFVRNHIALTAFSSVTEADTVTVQMLSNKYYQFKNGTVMAESNVVTADQYASNGLFHIISAAIEPKQNIWQYINSLSGSNAMSDYLLSLKQFDLYRSDSIAKANEPEIHELYADSLKNSYLHNVYNLNNEKNKYTFFLLKDGAFNDEVEKLKPYLIKGTVESDSTTTYASYFATRDLAFHKAVARENLPDTLVSSFGVKVPINEDNIVEDIILSNGIVYVMDTMDVPLETRLLTTQIEGEEPIGFSENVRSNTLYREKDDPDGVFFNDIMVLNHGTPELAINYNIGRNIYSTTYEVYWRAVNDRQNNTFKQRLRIGGTIMPDGTVENPVAFLEGQDGTGIEVNPDVYDDVFVGEFTLEEARAYMLSLVAANTGSNGENTLTLDYLKLVPLIK